MMNLLQRDIDDLLRFQQGIETGLKPLEIVKSLYGDLTDEEVLEKLAQLKRTRDYLNGFFGFPGGNNGSK
jgi:hypothetical protein